MSDNYYQKHKKNLQKEAGKKYQHFFEEQKKSNKGREKFHFRRKRK